MKFPTEPRYKNIVDSIKKFFTHEKIDSFPIDPFSIIEKNNWGLISYSELAEIHDVTIDRIIKAYGSEDGFVIRDNENYTIAYNDTKGPFGRIRFTLMHEIGHIYLNHLVDFKETKIRRNKLSEKKYAILELEAHAFARNTLSPPVIVNKLKEAQKKITPENLMYYFNITKKAAQTRLDFLIRDTLHSITYGFYSFSQFENYVNQILFSKFCSRCKYYFVSPDAEFCPICQFNKLLKIMNRGKSMIYTGYYLDHNGRPEICPRCENEDISSDDKHCRVCGIFVVNKCTNIEYSSLGDVVGECGTTAAGNARYCTKCGSVTTYFEQGLLKPWDKEQTTSKTNNASNIEIDDSDLPF